MQKLIISNLIRRCVFPFLTSAGGACLRPIWDERVFRGSTPRHPDKINIGYAAADFRQMDAAA